MLRRSPLCSALLSSAFLFSACDAPSEAEVDPNVLTKGGGDGKSDASAVAIFVELSFEGELLASSSFNPPQQIQDQLLYTIGQLNGENSVGRLDKLELTDVEVVPQGNKFLIRYQAMLPVAWGKRNQIPTQYTLTMPRDMSHAGTSAFTAKYKESCVDLHAHDVTPGSMWYYYRPNASRCELDAADIVTFDAAVSISDINTTGKYPEYHKVWEDDALRVVAVFGKYEDGATTASDAGIAAYNKFTRDIRTELSAFGVESTPAEVPQAPGIAMPEVAFTAALPDGKSVEVVALLVDNIRTADATFNARYAELSTNADLIAYNGHAGLGANVRALAQKGSWKQGQYAVVFINGCDTYAYIDAALYKAHAAVNPDDEIGTKYVDIVTNAMPAFFHETANSTMAMVRGLMAFDQPRTYEQIFTNIDDAQVVLVSGEQDNEFVPGDREGNGEVVENWEGMSESGTVARYEVARFETPTLATGRYVFELSGTNDADLYVRVGLEPTEEVFECRPFKAGSVEACAVDLVIPSPVHVMVRGWSPSSQFTLTGSRE